MIEVLCLDSNDESFSETELSTANMVVRNCSCGIWGEGGDVLGYSSSNPDRHGQLGNVLEQLQSQTLWCLI